jgi:preprotein translocase subunit SecE
MAQASAGIARAGSGKPSETKTPLLERIKIFVQQVRTELAKVTWPTKDEVRTYAIVVIIATVIVCIMMGVWDYILTEIFFIILDSSAGGG